MRTSKKYLPAGGEISKPRKQLYTLNNNKKLL